MGFPLGHISTAAAPIFLLIPKLSMYMRMPAVVSTYLCSRMESSLLVRIFMVNGGVDEGLLIIGHIASSLGGSS